jgi:group I intron endonuclease
MNTGVIYVATNRENGKQYVGQAVSFDPHGRKWGSHRRWQVHVKNATTGRCECRLLENAIRKYGADTFDLEDVDKCQVDDLNDLEDKRIVEFNTLAPNGYNLMTGGGNGRRHSTETRELMSKTRTGKRHSDLTRQRMSEASSGRKVSAETVQRISDSSKYRNMSDDNRKRLDDALHILGLAVLPMYLCLSVDRRGGRNVDIINVRVPKTKTKKFGKKDMTLQNKISMGIDYLELVNGHRSEGSTTPMKA